MGLSLLMLAMLKECLCSLITMCSWRCHISRYWCINLIWIPSLCQWIWQSGSEWSSSSATANTVRELFVYNRRHCWRGRFWGVLIFCTTSIRIGISASIFVGKSPSLSGFILLISRNNCCCGSCSAGHSWSFARSTICSGSSFWSFISTNVVSCKKKKKHYYQISKSIHSFIRWSSVPSFFCNNKLRVFLTFPTFYNHKANYLIE